jgi:tripartite motif-containing protein 71
MKPRALVAPVLLTIVLAAALLPAVASAQPPAYLYQWGSGGSGPGQFQFIYGVTVDANGNVYVVEGDSGANQNRVQKFTSSGTYLTQWGPYWEGGGYFDYSVAVAVDGNGDVYVADAGISRIQKFTSSGVHLAEWWPDVRHPAGIAVDGSDNVYVADTDNHRIQVFTSKGTYVTQWGAYGSGAGQFDHPVAVTVDGSGNVYVADFGNSRIQKFTTGGTYLTQWGTPGVDPVLWTPDHWGRRVPRCRRSPYHRRTRLSFGPA